MESAFLYLPDDEPESHLFNGHRFHLEPNQTTEFIPYQGSKAACDLIDQPEIDGTLNPSYRPGVQVSRWPNIRPAEIAAHLAERLAPWGVVQTKGPVKGDRIEHADDEVAVEKAEAQYLKGTNEWAENVILQNTRANKSRVEAGLEPVVTAEVERARAWLSRAKR